MEILDAGIAVISTLNVQHIESIADAVEVITEAKVRERVPDWVVRRADQIELIDSSPEQLRRRMLHGNIYPSTKIEAALQGFFKTQNLVALRGARAALRRRRGRGGPVSSTSESTPRATCGRPPSA